MEVKHFHTYILLIFVLYLVITACNKDITTGTLSGNIYFAGTLTPVPGVELDVDGEKSVSSDLGAYKIEGIITGKHSLKAEKEGFEPFYSEITITSGTVLFDISMTPQVLTDARDGQTYDYKTIGTQTWMIENLNFEPSSGNSWCYDNLSDNCLKYGRLYDWDAATADTHGNNQDICPSGWHLPSDEEWKVLEIFLGMSATEADDTGWRNSGNLGKQMKSVSGSADDGNGNNISGFNVLPGGKRNYHGGFSYLGSRTSFWSSSPSGPIFGWNRSLQHYYNGIARSDDYGGDGFSIRCLKN